MTILMVPVLVPTGTEHGAGNALHFTSVCVHVCINCLIAGSTGIRRESEGTSSEEQGGEGRVYMPD